VKEWQELRRTRYADGLPTGEAVITSAGNLPMKYVIHTVGPIYGNEPDRDAELLASCYRNSLALAREHDVDTIAFPAISTGIYGYPKTEAAAISSRTIKDFLIAQDVIKQVWLVFFHEDDARVFHQHQEFE